MVVKLGLQLGYWGATPTRDTSDLVGAAEEAGFDACFTAEAYGSDAFTPLAWWGRQTSRLRLGTSIAQLSARTPTATAMAALTLDHLSAGRTILGLGVSGPQVVEGWYGQPFAKPLARTREYVEIIRKVWARQGPVTSSGEHYPLPYRGSGAVGVGKPLKSIVHPLRADIPIWLGAEGPKNIAQTAEIADGWLPIFFSPSAADLYRTWLDEGFARPSARQSRETFEVAASCYLHVTDDPRSALESLKPIAALYMGGMGAKDQNFHKNLFEQMGYGALAEKVQELYLDGKKADATALIPDELVDSLHIVGDAVKVRERVQQWEESGVTTLLLACHTVPEVRRAADVILG